MNISCHVIEDLLPLYHDGVCSEESRALVEEHLSRCEACAALHRKMSGEEETVAVDDTAALQSIQKEWKKSRGKALWRGVIAATLVLSVIAYALSWVDTFKTVPVPAEAMEVTELS
ncbi:MAG: zf-HC2 domain-containing protein [Oscillospiraceae bacterium]|nr:zf-HC2 domain-containing protein [Oscillospiraceae bacterium]